jgi:nickel-dependent lactate racemase
MHSVNFDREILQVNIPAKNVLGVLDVPDVPFVTDLKKSLSNALENPIGTKPFSKLFKPSDKVCVLVSDITRVSITKTYLPFLLDELNRLGIPNENIFIVFTVGTHRKHSAEEHQKLVGQEVYNRVKVFDHEARDKSQHVYLGTTKRGTKVYVFKKAMEADKIITTGTIGFHYFAGYNGGRKNILPGIAGYETIVANHKMTMFCKRKGEEKFSAAGIYDRNPINEDMNEAAGMVSPCFMINVVLDKRRNIIKFFTGDIIKAHKKGTEFINKLYRPKIKQLADMVVASCGGHPLDVNFVQAHKAIHQATYAVKEGGVIIAVGACSEGYGSESIEKYLCMKSVETIERALAKNYEIQGQTARAMLKKSRNYRIIFITKLPQKDVRAMGMIPAANMDEALELALRWVPEDFGAYMIPNSMSILPKLVKR